MSKEKKIVNTDFINCIKENFIYLTAISTIPVLIYGITGWVWVTIPWLPITLIGVLAIIVVGIHDTANHNRLKEARKVWGDIINDSRIWGMMVKAHVKIYNTQEKPHSTTQLHSRIIRRHIAWLIALRYQLRYLESQGISSNKSSLKKQSAPHRENKLKEELKPLISDFELKHILTKSNRASQLLDLQAQDLKEMYNHNLIEQQPYTQLMEILKDFFNHQGQAERIKKLPYPNQLSSINIFCIYILTLLIPFGLIEPFVNLGILGIWFIIPISILIGGILTYLKDAAHSIENPFGKSANTTPMRSLIEIIEIDLLEMLDEENISLVACRT